MTLALYVPRASPVHRAPAGVKLIVLAGLAVLLFAEPSLPVAAATLVAATLTGTVAARLPLALLVRHARAVAVWLMAIVAVHALTTGWRAGVETALRVLALVLAAAVVTATTRTTAMVAVVERVCAPLRWVGVRPAHVGLVFALTLRFIPLVAERADRVREARVARGGPVHGVRAMTTTIVPLVVQLLQLAHTVSEALDARGAGDEPVPRHALP